jgi:hypothetical protein
MSFVDRYLPYFGQQLITHPLSAFLPFHPLFTESLLRDQLFASPPFSGALSATLPLCCLLIFSSLFIVKGFVCVCLVQGSVCPGGYAGLSQELLGEYHMTLSTHLFGLPNVSQAGLELASGSGGSFPLFSV